MLVCPLVFARDRSVGTRASEIEFVSRDDPLSRRPSPPFFPFGPLTSPPVAGVRENLGARARRVHTGSWRRGRAGTGHALCIIHHVIGSLSDSILASLIVYRATDRPSKT